ncbi:MAG: DMT family transporter [Vallitaleaceae bacterium]|jgi:drug/metabolite transporter (DMT)-like permease|nr:DMT family transporter [Vallitaleaceae bacterium]
MKKRTGILLGLLACFIWAGAFPTIKLIYGELDISSNLGAKMTLAGLRFSIAGLLILIFYTVRFKKLPKISVRKDLLKLIFLGLVQTALLYAFFFNGISNATGIKSAILSQSSIFFVIVLAHFFLKGEKVSINKWLGLVLGFLGIVIVNLGELMPGEGLFSFSLSGEGFLLFAGLFSALGTIMVKKLGRFVHPVLMNGWQMTFGGIVLLIYGLILNKGLVTLTTGRSVVLLIILIAIAACGFTIWFILLQHFKAGEISVYKFTIPIMGSLLSAAFIMGEHITVKIFIGLALVSLGIILSNKTAKKV